MRIIETVNSTKFSLDGIEYFKNYISEVAGNQITIFNCYDRRDIRVDYTNFANIELNGVVYGTVAELQSALLPIIYTRASLGGGGSQNLQQVTDEGNITTNEVVSSNNSGVNGSSLTPFGVMMNQSDGASTTTLKSTHEDGDLEVDFVDGGTNATREWVTANVTGYSVTVVSSNTTASNDTNYNVVANATFTDPTPAEGKGYVVFVRNGTATIGGVGYAVGRIIYRVFHSGAWSSTIYVDQAYIDAKVADSITNGVTNIAPSQNVVFDALALKVDTTSWIDISNTSTIVGWSSFTQRHIYYKIIDGYCFVDFYLEGTSNSATTTFTMPFNSVQGFSVFRPNGYNVNNGTASTNAGRIAIATASNLVILNNTLAGGAYTSSGTKGSAGQISFKV